MQVCLPGRLEFYNTLPIAVWAALSNCTLYFPEVESSSRRPLDGKGY